MKFIFNVLKSCDSSDDEFESAINCAKDCIESVLDDDSLSVTVIDKRIVIESIDHDREINFTLAECKENVKGCFCDASGKLYPEFMKIEPSEG